MAAADRAGAVRRYYEQTWFEYRLLWLDRHTRAMHFGYEQPGDRSHARSLLALNHVMAEHARLHRGERVLDAGCGVGGTSLWLAEEYDATVVGVNLVEDHVERARRYGRERHLGGQVRFEVADYTATGLPAGSFDVVWAQESACHASDKAAFAEEAARLLRPGGRLVMAEYLVVPGREGSDDLRVLQDGWAMSLDTEDGWRRTFEGAGFADLDVDDISPKVRRSLQRLARWCAVLGPVDAALQKIGARNSTQRGNVEGSMALWRAFEAGDWRYGIVTARRP
jgi:cyclopropane fatty-acyl-phospholipid synthase-like methyltransferase